MLKERDIFITNISPVFHPNRVINQVDTANLLHLCVMQEAEQRGLWIHIEWILVCSRVSAAGYASAFMGLAPRDMHRWAVEASTGLISEESAPPGCLHLHMLH